MKRIGRAVLAACITLPFAACSSDDGDGGRGGGGGDGNGAGTGGGAPVVVPGDGNSPIVPVDIPKTCGEASSSRSYVGCEFWPTITANPVWQEFLPAVVIANGGAEPAEITVTRDGFEKKETVPPGELRTVMLDWVGDLKGPEFSLSNTANGRLEASGRVDGGAYHLVSSVPVTAWQFNPLKYRLPKEECGSRIQMSATATECRAASNDASILLPATAMTGNYRVFGYSSKHEGKDWGSVPGGMAITATQDNTSVSVQLGPKCGVVLYPTTDLGTCVAAGPGVEAKNAGDVYTFTMNAGDVVQLVGAWNKDPQVANADISGSVVNATAPVQVISFNAIAMLPDVSVGNADHMEETVLPAEVLGNEYIVPVPTAPHGKVVGHVVRLYGNVDGTQLTYPEGKPAGAPDVLNAGDVVQIPALPVGAPAPACLGNGNQCMLSEAFIVQGSQPFAVGSFMVGGAVQEGNGYDSLGDPSFMMMVTPEQFRQEYAFLAPTDFVENYADILLPSDAEVLLDGKPLTSTPEAIGASGWSIARELLSNDTGGIHTVTTTHERGVGVQVAGFGYATSYYYPGGLNLKLISEPPIIK